MTFNRRRFLASGALASGLGISSTSVIRAQPRGGTFDLSKDDWLDAATRNKGLGDQLHVSRFVERIYYLTKPVAWFPNPGQERFRRVDVPVGFITDFASIPAPFWPLLPPDGEYTRRNFQAWHAGSERTEVED
jgi:hypothetical protein